MSVTKKLEQLETLIELAALVNSTLDPFEIRTFAIESSMRLLNTEAASLILVDPDSGALFFEVALGVKGEKLKSIKLQKGQGIAGWVIDNNQPVIVHDVHSDQRFYSIADEKSSFSTKNMICVPVKSKNKILGALESINKKEGMFTEEDKDALIALANQVAIAIENANLYQQLKETFYSTVEALAETIEKRDPYTGGHTKRVMNYSYKIGKEMGLMEQDLERLKLAAILHDVGKIGIKDDILLKQTRLSHDEMLLMNMHTSYGSEILHHIKYLKDVIPGVLSHHERLDGTGYPDKLRNDDIPLIAKIIAVADAFDAMTTDRPYRKALSFEEAFSELQHFSNLQFDQKVVEAFLSLLHNKNFIGRNNL